MGLARGFRINGIIPALPGVAMIAAVGFFFDYTGRARPVSEAAHYCALWISFAVALAIYSYVVATLRMPMWDLRFARMDAALGFNWSAGFDWITSSIGRSDTYFHMPTIVYSSRSSFRLAILR